MREIITIFSSLIKDINEFFSFKEAMGYTIMNILAFTYDQLIASIMSIIIIGLVMYKLKKSLVISNNSSLIKWLQEVEKVEHQAILHMAQFSHELDKLCNKAQELIPVEYHPSFPTSWDKTEELARKQNIKYKIPGDNLVLGHHLLKTKITKKLVSKIIKDKGSKLKG